MLFYRIDFDRVVQLGENNLQNALLAYQTALRLPTNFPGREKLVWQSAFAINQIRLKLDDAVQELSDKLVSVQILDRCSLSLIMIYCLIIG